MGIPHGAHWRVIQHGTLEEMIHEAFMLDGMLIAVAAPDDYAGPLEF